LQVKSDDLIEETKAFLSKKYGGTIRGLETVRKEDLDLANHLVGLKQTFIKMSFLNMTDLQKVRKELLTAVRKNKERMKSASAYQVTITRLKIISFIKPELFGSFLDLFRAFFSFFFSIFFSKKPDIGRYNIIDIISYHYITFSRILIFLYHFLKGDIFVI
jgi:hypothetical protein